MIRDALRRAIGRAPRQRAPGMIHMPVIESGSGLPFGMFDHARSAEEARKAHKLERLYHKGQKLAWNGKDVLDELIAKHPGSDLPPRQREALRTVFAVILWGELAAWKISTDLATHLVDLEPKMAATSQSHDEARHFYVMHDYLAWLGDVPKGLGPATQRVLEGTLQADTLAKKLLGMQMMIEPMALTLFQMVRQNEIEPVLSDLLVYYERDEARHVALGVLHLPQMLEGLTWAEAMELWAWQMRQYFAQFAMLHELAPEFEALGVHPRDVLHLGREKQLLAAKLLFDELGHELPVVRVFRAMTDFRAELEFPRPGDSTRRRDRLRKALEAAWKNTIDDVTGDLSDVARAA